MRSLAQTSLFVWIFCSACTGAISDPSIQINRFGLDDPKVCQSTLSRANFHYLTPNEIVYANSHKHGTKSSFNKLLLKVLGRTRKKSTCSVLLAPPYNYDSLQYLKIEFEVFIPSCDATLIIKEIREHKERSSELRLTCGSKPPDSYITSRGSKVYIMFTKEDEFTDFTFRVKVTTTGFEERSETFSIGMKIAFGVLGFAGLIFIIGAILQLASKCNSSCTRRKTRGRRHPRETDSRGLTNTDLPDEQHSHSTREEVLSPISDQVPPPYELCTESEMLVCRNVEEDVTLPNDSYLEPPSYSDAIRMIVPQR